MPEQQALALKVGHFATLFYIAETRTSHRLQNEFHALRNRHKSDTHQP